jgi:hypothetical protein
MYEQKDCLQPSQHGFHKLDSASASFVVTFLTTTVSSVSTQGQTDSVYL